MAPCLISKATRGGCNYKSKFVTICAAAWSEPGVHTQKQPSSIPPHPHFSVPLLASWSAIWLLCGHGAWAVNTQQLRESPATDMALNSNQTHSAPSIGPENRESEAGGPNMSTKQWPPPSEPWRHTWMPDGEANYVFFLVGAASLREHFITGGNHETARGIPIPEFGMKCVEAQTRSAALKHQTSQCSSSETRQKKTGLFCWGKCYARVHHRLALVMAEIPARRPLTIVTRSWAGSSWLVDTRAVQRASNRTLLLFSLVTILYCQSTVSTVANGVGRHFQYPISALPTTRCGDS